MLARDSRLHRLITKLGVEPTSRKSLRERLAVGVRTFYRVLDLLKRCAIKAVVYKDLCKLNKTISEVQFYPLISNFHLSFAKMAKLSRACRRSRSQVK